MTLAQRAILVALLGALLAGVSSLLYLAWWTNTHKPAPPPPPPTVRVVDA